VSRRAIAVVGVTAMVVSVGLVPAGALGAARNPSITGFEPTSGHVGVRVTIDGNGFGAHPGVLFGGVNAPGAAVNAAGTRIRVRVPPMAVDGRITVTTPAGSRGVSSTPFDVTFGAAVSKTSIFRGQLERVSGTALRPDTDLVVQLDGHRFAGVATDRNGNFTLLKPIPPTIDTGPKHVLDLTCAICHLPPPLFIHIFSDWPQGGFDAGQSRDNTDEWGISVANVGTLAFRMNESPSGPPAQPIGDPFVEGLGLRYLTDTDAGNNGLLGADAPYLSGDWLGVTDGPMSEAAAVAGTTVYAVTGDQLYAYDALRSSANCPQSQACVPLWWAVLPQNTDPFAPVVADGEVFLTTRSGDVEAFDAAGVTNCSGSPLTCTPLWKHSFGVGTFSGPPAIIPATSTSAGIVFVSEMTNAARLVAYSETGTFLDESNPLPAASVSSPAIAGGRIAVSGTTPNTTTRVVTVLDPELVVQWTSTNLGGGNRPSAPAITGGKVFVVNANGKAAAFKAAGCGTSICDPVWTSAPLGAGNSVAPIVANGVLFVAAGADIGGYDQVFAFDGAGIASCSGTPKVCTPLWTGPSGAVGNGMSVFAGGLWMTADLHANEYTPGGH
jgi:outer membrane protein assembly factor BamB